jgi:hypothetical protein
VSPPNSLTAPHRLGLPNDIVVNTLSVRIEQAGMGGEKTLAGIMSARGGDDMRQLRESTRTERRLKARYPIKLKVRYGAVDQLHCLKGIGETVDFSSAGFLVVAHHECIAREGSEIEAIVEWPILRNGTIPLELVVFGRVVRSETSRFAVSFSLPHVFRTTKRGPVSVSAKQVRHEVG